ncbi:MAG: hypothetical protein KF744_06295 [Taibaiella sp.]|nr:hypothetical protein [Taibaiella sp.]
MLRLLTLSALGALIALSFPGYGQSDTLPGLVRNSYGTDHYALSAAISFDQHGDRAKAKSIYNWVTHNIKYDVTFLQKFPKPIEDKGMQALKTGRAVCEGYSELFVMLCRDAGLQAIAIEGYSKDFLFNNGDRFYMPRHEWAAVKIDGKWELVDATWGAGSLYQHRSWLRKSVDKVFHIHKVRPRSLRFRYLYDPQYFAQDPELFRLRHLPSDPIWQLTDTLMPLSVFEAGATAITTFNGISKLKQTGATLDSIAAMTKQEKIYDFADRAYAFNNRYPVILAIKDMYHAVGVVKQVAADSGVSNVDTMLKVATNDLKRSLERIKDQRKMLPEQYNNLKRSNRAKSTDAKQQVRTVVADDKRLIGVSSRYIQVAESRKKKALGTSNDVTADRKAVAAANLAGVEASGGLKKEGARELEELRDSIRVRNLHAETDSRIAAAKNLKAKLLILSSTSLLDSLMKSIVGEDSILRNEAMERMGMHDSYDDEVQKWNTVFKDQKYKGTDTLMKYYLLAYDSILLAYDDLFAARQLVIGSYDKNIAAYQQYKKWNAGYSGINEDFLITREHYLAACDSYVADLATYTEYLDGNIGLFNMLKKISERQIKIVGYMEKAEKSRADIETGSIARKKAFDLKENDKLKANVQKALKELKKASKYKRKDD